MAKLDKIHNAVKAAIEKDGWIITNDLFTIRYGEQILYADLAAEKILAAEKDNQKIAIEIKSFLSISKIKDFENALGQYNLYQAYLEIIEPERQLFLAISDKIYEDFFARPEIEVIIKRFNLKIVTVDLSKETIVKWIK